MQESDKVIIIPGCFNEAIFLMQSINSSIQYFNNDPFINAHRPILPSDRAPNSIEPNRPPQASPPKLEPKQPSTLPSKIHLTPNFAKSVTELPDRSLIVCRSKPETLCRGPNIELPVLGIDFNNAVDSSKVCVACTSTYPDENPYNPIADRFEVRGFKNNTWILTLADGCGLHISSRLAPQSAMDGFWRFITQKLEQDKDIFTTQKMAHYLEDAIQAGHQQIYWDAYLRSADGLSSKKDILVNELNQVMKSTDLSAEEIDLKKDQIKQDLELILRGLDGDLIAQKSLMQKNLDSRFYENFAGATTFLCSALLKSSGADASPYYLLTISLGDCQGFLFRDGELRELTKDSRDDISNCRDPGGRLGFCTQVPLKIDDRNLQYSLTPCQSDDLLFFMTDGVVDNLEPQRLGLELTKENTPNWALDKLMNAGALSEEDLNDLFVLFEGNGQLWNDLKVEIANDLKIKFTKVLLQKIISKNSDYKAANDRVVQFCKKITSDYRDKQPSWFDLFSSNHKVGKPDHTTCVSFQIPQTS